MFRPGPHAERLRDHIKFDWEMVCTSNGSVAAVGVDILVVDDQERIRLDYTFIDP